MWRAGIFAHTATLPLEPRGEAFQHGEVLRVLAAQGAHLLGQRGHAPQHGRVLLLQVRIAFHAAQLDAEGLQLAGFVGDQRFQRCLAAGHLGAIFLQQALDLGRRRDLVQAGEAQRVIPGAAR